MTVSLWQSLDIDIQPASQPFFITLTGISEQPSSQNLIAAQVHKVPIVDVLCMAEIEIYTVFP